LRGLKNNARRGNLYHCRTLAPWDHNMLVEFLLNELSTSCKRAGGVDLIDTIDKIGVAKDIRETDLAVFRAR
jgi:hypothetical protein